MSSEEEIPQVAAYQNGRTLDFQPTHMETNWVDSFLHNGYKERVKSTEHIPIDHSFFPVGSNHRLSNQTAVGRFQSNQLDPKYRSTSLPDFHPYGILGEDHPMSEEAALTKLKVKFSQTAE